jgi:hypothetical protein
LCPRPVFAGKGLKIEVKKYGTFQDLFFVEGEGVKGDWAICNKRFVRRIHRLVIKERRWKMMEYELMDDGKLEMGPRKTRRPQMTPISQNGRDGALGRLTPRRVRQAHRRQARGRQARGRRGCYPGTKAICDGHRPPLHQKVGVRGRPASAKAPAFMWLRRGKSARQEGGIISGYFRLFRL